MFRSFKRGNIVGQPRSCKFQEIKLRGPAKRRKGKKRGNTLRSGYGVESLICWHRKWAEQAKQGKRDDIKGRVKRVGCGVKPTRRVTTKRRRATSSNRRMGNNILKQKTRTSPVATSRLGKMQAEQKGGKWGQVFWAKCTYTKEKQRRKFTLWVPGRASQEEGGDPTRRRTGIRGLLGSRQGCRREN